MRATFLMLMLLGGGGAFAQTSFVGTDVGAGDAASGIAVLDADGDGDNDLAIANRDDDSLTLLFNDGSGLFGTSETISLDLSGGTERPIAVVAGDFDADDRTDLAVLLLGTDEIAILQRGATGSLAVTGTVNTGDSARGMAVGLIDDDMILDLATANETDDTVSVLRGNGDGTFTAVDDVAVMIDAERTRPNAVAIGDVDGGSPDLVVALETPDQVAVLSGNGDGTFGDPTFFDTGANPLAVALVDLNGDGNLDIVTANSISDDISVLLGNGTGAFGTKTDFAAGNFARGLAIADLDGDGNLDVATPNGEGDTVSVLAGNGDGTFGSAMETESGNFPFGIVAADLDGMDQLDLATANQLGDSSTILLAGEAIMIDPMACGAACGPMGAAPLALTLLGLRGLGWRRRLKR